MPMARADVRVVLTSTGTLQETDIGLATAVTKVILDRRFNVIGPTGFCAIEGGGPERAGSLEVA
ncbi:MAG: hypothetical protein IT431_17075 [Phycisphaerales bacterium]|nr:hypothetical protein [Phycisphaerales bacterium]